MAKITLNGVDALTESGGVVTIPGAANLTLGTGAVPTAAIQANAITNAKTNPELSQRQAFLARRISTRHKIRMPYPLRMVFCKKCPDMEGFGLRGLSYVEIRCFAPVFYGWKFLEKLTFFLMLGKFCIFLSIKLNLSLFFLFNKHS